MCKDAVTLAVTIIGVTTSRDTYGMQRAIHFRLVWQLEACRLDDRQRRDGCALRSTAFTLQHSLQLNENSKLNSQYSKHFTPKKSKDIKFGPQKLQSAYLHQIGPNA